jgi:membrane-associated protease RseP (regulator of RpoE activity)
MAWMPPPRKRFQHNYTRHLLFFVLTFFTTTFAPAFAFMWMALDSGVNPLSAFTWPVFLNGLWYSIPLLTILSAHEFGHYFACRAHNVDATLPYFLPAPLPLTGTLGAVIRIREAFPSKRALFDIGVAGPIAGFVALVPFLIWGITLSEVGQVPGDQLTLYFGEPLLWKVLEWFQFGVLPEGTDVMLHPMGFAAWWGMLATALNLLPFGQLDGGHIMYAAVGRRAAWLSGATLLLVVVLTMRSASWFAMALMMVIMAIVFGFRHPRIVDEHEPLDRKRQMIALSAVVIFVLCFTPVPIDTIGPE